VFAGTDHIHVVNHVAGDPPPPKCPRGDFFCLLLCYFRYLLAAANVLSFNIQSLHDEVS